MKLVFAVGYTMDVVVFSWLDDPVEIDEKVQLPQFDLKDVTQRDCSQNYTAGITTQAPQPALELTLNHLSCTRNTALNRISKTDWPHYHPC